MPIPVLISIISDDNFWRYYAYHFRNTKISDIRYSCDAYVHIVGKFMLINGAF